MLKKKQIIRLQIRQKQEHAKAGSPLKSKKLSALSELFWFLHKKIL